MAYNLQPSQTSLTGGINILASEHVQFIEVGATMDATKFATGVVPVGTVIARNTTTDKFEPYVETEAGTLEEGYTDFSILNVDFVNDGEHDTIVGEVIVRGSVYEDKLASEVSDAFKAANPMIRYVPAR